MKNLKSPSLYESPLEVDSRGLFFIKNMSFTKILSVGDTNVDENNSNFRQ